MGSLMSNFIKSCFVAVFILVLSGIHGKTLALDLTSAIFYTPIELKPIAYSHGVKLANVFALHDTNCTNKTIYIDSADYGVQCENEGYSLTSCDSGKKSSDSCPYDSTYFKQCVCDTSAYNKTDTSNCAGGNLTSCTDESGTYYKCDCNTANTTLCSGGTEYHPASAATCISSEGEIKYENSACLECSNNQVPNATHTDCVCPSTWLNNCSNGCSNITGGDGTCWKDGYEYCQNCKACDDTCAPVTVNIGDILYSDMSVSKDLKNNKTPIGVVFDATNRYAVALTQASSYMTWGGYGTDISGLTNCTNSSTVKTTCGTNEKSNTQTIIAQGGSYPAASYCNSYSTAGTSAGDWWLPSFKELYTIYTNKTAINAGLTKAGGSTLTDYYWSSTEYYSDLAWILNMIYGN